MGIPAVGLSDVAKGVFTGLQKGDTFVDNYPWLKTTVGFLGSSLAFDENRVWGPLEKRDKEKPKGFFTFVRRYCLANGYILGALGAIGMFVMNKFVKVEEGKQPGILHALGNLGTMVLTVGAPIIALYSQMKGVNVGWQCGKAGKTLSDLEKLLPSFEERKNSELVQKTQNSPLRFRQDEKEGIENAANRKNIRKIFIGPSGTGKTEAMDYVAGKIVEQEGADKVLVHKIECQKLRTLIESILQKKGQWLDLASSANSSLAEVVAWNSSNKVKELMTVFDGVLIKAQEAKKQNKRYVLQLDELDKLKDFAVYEKDGHEYIDLKMFKDISVKLKDVWDSTEKEGIELDILATSNVDINKLFGVGTLFQGTLQESLKLLGESALGPTHHRLRGDQCPVSLPDPLTQARIAAVYLLKVKNDLSETDEQLFDMDILAQIRNKSSDSEREDALTKYIYENIYQKLEKSNPQLFGEYRDNYEGRDLKKAIYENLSCDELMQTGIRKPGVKVNLFLLDKYLKTMMDKILGRFGEAKV